MDRDRHLRVVKKIWAIRYAREDSDAAMRLYNGLKNAGLNEWLDKYKIPPGQNWEYEIQDAIEHSRYIIPLFSSISVLTRLCYSYVFNDSLSCLQEDIHRSKFNTQMDSAEAGTSRLKTSHLLFHCLLLGFPCVHPFSANFQNV
jgi:hypothetical protein